MIKTLFQKYILPIIIAAAFGSGGFFVKGCQNQSTEKALNKEIKEKVSVIEKYTDSVATFKTELKISKAETESCRTDSAIMQGNIHSLQRNALALSNGNLRLKTELNNCEENMKKAIETGIIEVKEKPTFIQKLFNRK